MGIEACDKLVLRYHLLPTCDDRLFGAGFDRSEALEVFKHPVLNNVLGLPSFC